jgi:hypothetical protein
LIASETAATLEKNNSYNLSDVWVLLYLLSKLSKLLISKMDLQLTLEILKKPRLILPTPKSQILEMGKTLI